MIGSWVLRQVVQTSLPSLRSRWADPWLSKNITRCWLLPFCSQASQASMPACSSGVGRRSATAAFRPGIAPRLPALQQFPGCFPVHQQQVRRQARPGAVADGLHHLAFWIEIEANDGVGVQHPAGRLKLPEALLEVSQQFRTDHLIAGYPQADEQHPRRLARGTFKACSPLQPAPGSGPWLP